MLSELIQNMTLTVSQLNEYANRLLMNDELLQGVLVTGEISNFRRYPSGHWYFSLKDGQSAVRCVMFKQYNRSVAIDLKDGMNITVGGYASIYLRDGSFQIYVRTMKSDGAGALYQRYEQLKKDLAQQGLFDNAHKKPIPRYPNRIGVVTSPAGAVIRDIVEVARRRNPHVDILLAPASVQGKNAAGEIARAIALLNARDDIDVIIVGRGGGSIEDLWAFNEAVVAHAIFQSRIPVISAVGHETDTTISDYVADLRAPTPSAASELAVPVYDALLQFVDTVNARMQTAARQRLQQNQKRCDTLTAVLGPSRILELVIYQKQRVRHSVADINARLNAAITVRQQRMAMAEAKIEAYSIRSVLDRGYAVITGTKSKQLIQSVKQLQSGQDIRIILKNGAASAVVTQVDEREGTDYV